MEIKILYEDEYILALDKPSGLLVHADGRTKEETLVDWLSENYPSLGEVGEEQRLQNSEIIKRPGIVHRLDKDTSGVIVVAKTTEAYEFLKEQFQNRKVSKIYNAVVWGNFSPEKMEGIINKPIGRSGSDFRKWSAEHGAKGELREAVTEYKVLAQRSFSEVGPAQSSKNNPLNPPYIKGETKGFSYLEVKPKTGRTHQIRVHFKSISHPVVCDKLYSNKECSPEKCLGFDRLALHALSISLELPNGTHIKIESALPFEFENALAKLKNG
jgi:23S rRNA pseudouridine1911/1915/1917 synthase